ncbi:substrate-binding domain-containing protein [Actinomyces sp.]|uniref:substrate-binding domain-containing protein n=1 Tax=Actinomyces sp. TaxID=29317 RepID=UPI0026DCF2E2|nr:substrate-binding domain-containing protein [Actinomyces sp.]MDO4900377.1 substrate-binding domain-containing protein [Actinomyces sp.]
MLLGDDAQALPSNRRDQILKRLKLRGSVRTAALAEELGVTPITVRRDINELAQQGLVKRVRGGARLAVDPHSPTLLEAGTTMGFIAPSLDFYWPSIIEGANRAADEIGARILLQGSTFSARDNLSQVKQLVDHTQLDALAVVPDVESADSDRLIQYLEQLDMPLVLVEREAKPRSFMSRGFDSVVADHHRGGEISVQHLRSLGHRGIALLLDKPIPSRHAIAAGCAQALNAESLEPAIRCDTTQEEGGTRLARIKDFTAHCTAKGVTAIVVHSDEAALLVLECLLDSGVSVPEEMSVIAYDDELAAIARPALTAIAPPKQALGSHAIRTLASRLTSPEVPCTHLRIEPTLIVRDSTGPAPLRQ